MVAEVPKKRFSSPHKRTGRGPAPAIDAFSKAKAHNLYAIRRLPAQQVANETGLTVKQIYQLANREGWSQLREKMHEKQKQLVLARAERDLQEVVDAIAIKGKALSLGSLDAALAELETVGANPDGPRNLQALSQSAKNFVGIYRQATGLDAKQDQVSQVTNNLVFVGSLPSSHPSSVAKPEPVNVTPTAIPAPVVPA